MQHLSHCFMDPQGWLHASLSTLLEVHNISMPDRVSGPSRPEPSLERFVNMRTLTLTRVHRGRESCLPDLPGDLRILTLDAGRFGKKRCVAQWSIFADKACGSCSSSSAWGGVTLGCTDSIARDICHALCVVGLDSRTRSVSPEMTLQKYGISRRNAVAR